LWLQKLRAIDVQRGILHTYSRVVAGQIEKECITREPTLEYIDRNKNSEADELAKATTHNTPLPTDIFWQMIPDASIKTVDPEPRVVNII
jgi:hypothetical protein